MLEINKKYQNWETDAIIRVLEVSGNDKYKVKIISTPLPFGPSICNIAVNPKYSSKYQLINE